MTLQIDKLKFLVLKKAGKELNSAEVLFNFLLRNVLACTHGFEKKHCGEENSQQASGEDSLINPCTLKNIIVLLEINIYITAQRFIKCNNLFVC